MHNQQFFATKHKSVIFLHIPKAAGVTLNLILDREYGQQETLSTSSGKITELINQYQNLSHAQREKIRLLRGHMLFGLHESLSNQPVYITVLRNPVDRIVSHYYYVLRTPEHYLYNKVTSQNINLEQYVSNGLSTELDNGQTRIIAGEQNIRFGDCSKELLERAKWNLDNHFEVVGLTERFDETVLLMKKALGWRTFPFYVRKNATKSRQPIERISTQARNVIEEYNQLDCELYDYARNHFQKNLDQCDLTKIELKQFTILNHFYFLAYHLNRSFLKFSPFKHNIFHF